jgi:calcineurin-like phosphoesterase family protein
MTEINPKNTFLFSDPHFDHKNIIRYAHRPFKNVEQMNKTILKNYNKIVKDNSSVFFLGDMTLRKGARGLNFWLKQLKGNIIYFRGNHDPRGYKETVIHVDNLYFKLSHFPRNRGDWVGWMIHGHVHDKWPFINYDYKTINVSVDVTGFKPVRLSDIIKAVKKYEKGRVKEGRSPSHKKSSPSPYRRGRG